MIIIKYFCYLTDFHDNSFTAINICQIPLLNSFAPFGFILFFVTSWKTFERMMLLDNKNAYIRERTKLFISLLNSLLPKIAKIKPTNT